MTTKEKIAFVEAYINNHYGEELSEWLFELTTHCTTDEQIAKLYDMIW